MAVRQITKTLPLLSNALKTTSSRSYHIVSSLQDPDPFQYTNDGEKIYCGYTVKKGVKEDLGDVVESARAKAFDDSLNGVIHAKYEDNRDNQ